MIDFGDPLFMNSISNLVLILNSGLYHEDFSRNGQSLGNFGYGHLLLLRTMGELD